LKIAASELRHGSSSHFRTRLSLSGSRWRMLRDTHGDNEKNRNSQNRETTNSLEFHRCVYVIEPSLCDILPDVCNKWIPRRLVSTTRSSVVQALAAIPGQPAPLPTPHRGQIGAKAIVGVGHRVISEATNSALPGDAMTHKALRSRRRHSPNGRRWRSAPASVHHSHCSRVWAFFYSRRREHGSAQGPGSSIFLVFSYE
jgi:hypothetical protein